MGALDFKEIPSAAGGAGRDQFEFFAGEFLTQEGFRIVEGVDRGPDAGRDLIAEEIRTGPGGTTIVRWLVSCKHLAHSGVAVSQRDEANIRDRLEHHKCGGFIAFYSTVPTSGLSAFLKSLKDRFELLTYDPAHIERKLIERSSLRTVAARYLPASFNGWMQNSQYTQIQMVQDPQRIQTRFFLREPHRQLKNGLAEAAEHDALAFVIVYDPKHPTLSKLNYSLGYFMEYHTTKCLVDQHFVAVVGPASDANLSALVPADDPLENILWIDG